MMIKFRLAEILKKRGWTAYRLAKETGITTANVYRLANPRQDFGRFTVDTLDKICNALEVQPGELFLWIRSKPNRKKTTV